MSCKSVHVRSVPAVSLHCHCTDLEGEVLQGVGDTRFGLVAGASLDKDRDGGCWLAVVEGSDGSAGGGDGGISP